VIQFFLYSFIVLIIDIWKSHVYSPIYGLQSIKSRSCPYQNIEITLTRYRDLRDRILYANSLCTIIFIDIPYYSITIANKCISERTFGSKSDRSISIKRDNKAKNTQFECKGRGKYPSLVGFPDLVSNHRLHWRHILPPTAV
jgi:hypothetical protein